MRQIRGVVGLVGVKLGGPAPTGPTPRPDRGDRLDQRWQRFGIVGVGGRNPTDSGVPARSDRTWIFEPGLPRSTGLGPVKDPLARTLAASITARDQSIKPWPPSSSSTARCRRRHRPASVHAVKRRCAVGTVTSNDGGSSRHAQPLVSTNTTAANTARSSAGAVPPPCGCSANAGNNGSTNPHNSSGTRRLDNSSPTSRTSCSTTRSSPPEAKHNQVGKGLSPPTRPSP